MKKYINSLIERRILGNKKNYLFAIAFSCIAFNCEAMQPAFAHESNDAVYSEGARLTSSSDNRDLVESLRNGKKIFAKAREDRNKSFESAIDIKSLKRRVQENREDKALQNGLVLYYIAHQYYSGKISKEEDIGNLAKKGGAIERGAQMFGFEGTDELKHDIIWYLETYRYESVQKL